MKNKGKIFEEKFYESSQKQNIFIHRLKDTDLSFNGNPVSSFTPTNKCDFYLFGNIEKGKGNLFAIECKSTKYSSMSIELNEEETNAKMIKLHQMKSLHKMSQIDGIYAGFVLNFRDEEKNLEDTYYMSIEKFLKFLQETQKKSINKTDCELRGIKVESVLLRKYYNYNVERMIRDIVKEE